MPHQYDWRNIHKQVTSLPGQLPLWQGDSSDKKDDSKMTSHSEELQELTTLTDQTVIFHDGSLKFYVTVKDVRLNYGHQEALIIPVAGSGSRWVRRSSLTLAGDQHDQT
jgi:Na+-transporting NADH:ubiquinone oxidoreductase subunit NqrC